MEVSILVDLSEDRAQAPRCVRRPGGGIGDEGVLSVGFWESHHRFRRQLFL